MTERDVALLLLSEDSWVHLGAMLALRAQLPTDDLRAVFSTADAAPAL